MAKFVFLCFILGNLLLDLSVASDEKPQAMVESSSSSSNPPAEAPSLRKLGKHSVSEAEKSSVEAENNGKFLSSSSHDEHNGSHSHHSIDKSVAGGGVILGGLATTFLVAVFCYIRATGRHKPKTTPA